MDIQEKVLNDFIKKSKIDNDMLADIFRTLVTTYKHETVRQHTIRAMITFYEKKYGAEMRRFAKDMKKRKELARNEYASTEKQDQRVMFSFPDTLYQRLTMIVKDPDFMSDDAIKKLREDEWLMREFPQYFVPDKF